VPAGEQSRKLFNQLLAWGLSMTVVGALLCWVMFGWSTQPRQVSKRSSSIRGIPHRSAQRSGKGW